MRNLLLILCLLSTGIVTAQRRHPERPGQPGHEKGRDTGKTVKIGDTLVLRKVQDSNRTGKGSDTLLRSRTPDTAGYGRRRFDSSLFSSNAPTRSDYLESLEKVFETLNQVPAITGSFFQLDEIHDRLDLEDSALAILKERLAQDDRTFNVRNLQMFNTLLDEINKNIADASKRLAVYDGKMDEIKKSMIDLRKDTLIRHIFRDTALRASFLPQLTQLRSKWKMVDSVIKYYTADINNLKARASSNTIGIQEMIYRVDTELKAVGTRAFGKERRYLWEPRTSNTKDFSRDAFRRSAGGEQKLARYYFANTRSKRTWLYLTALIFFYWVWSNFRTLRRMNKMETLTGFQFRYLTPLPIASTLIFALSLAPLFDLHAPAIYIESIQFILMVLLTFIFYRRLPRNLFYGWCLVILLFLILPFTRILGLSVTLQRWITFMLNSISVALGLIFFLHSKKIKELPRPVLFSAGLYIFLNLLAVLCNLFGRVTLSQIFATTAVYAFAQTVSLAVFVQLVVEAFLLQIQTSRVRKNYPEHFDVPTISRSIYRFSTALAVILWLIVFTTNLNLFDAINDLLVDILTAPRKLGSINYTLGGIILFAGIIWVANFLQRYIAFFFGDTGDDAAIDDSGQRSRLLVTRLILLTVGFMLAVAASGLPVDKITVVLGALGVGIGLGLQSIVNNFVSGIILIFDRPLRIGDTVEIGDKKGRVKEIGIRSSTLLTEDGAEVIIPNGDVLSHNIVNWTLSNNHVRVSLSFVIDKPGKPEDIHPEKIKEIIRSNPNVLERREPEIILDTVNARSIEIKIHFWVKDFGKMTTTSGEIRTALYAHLENSGIKVA